MQLNMSKEEKNYRAERKRFILLIFSGCIVLMAVIFVSLIQGNYTSSAYEVVNAFIDPKQYQQIYTIVLYSRMPRLIASIFVGAALSAAGWVYQEVFANRMVSSDVLGVSSGAGVGAAFGFVLGCNIAVVSIMAFISGLGAVIAAIAVTRLFGRGANRTLSLILSGIVVNGFMSSLLGLVKYISNDAQLATITYWLLGGFYNVRYQELAVVIPLIGILLWAAYTFRWRIMMIKNGEIDARAHGINYVFSRNMAIIIATVITAASVSISGTIGWIGLAVPNFVRIIIRDNEKYVLPLVILYGMIFTSICDLCARSITKTEVPIGIITGILGAVLFISVLIVRRKDE